MKGLAPKRGAFSIKPAARRSIMKRVACIHTVYSVIEEFTRQLRQELPEGCLIHTMYDDFLATDPAATGVFSSANFRRLRLDLQTQAMTGADLLLVSCSTLSPAVHLLRKEFPVPVVAIDDAMMEAAAAMGEKIGLLATAASTVQPSSDALLAAAQAVEKKVDVQVLCNEGAIRALKAGDIRTHDRLVLEMADRLEGRDVVVLAQASMAHLEARVSARTGLPTLSSPRRCVEQVRRLLERTSPRVPAPPLHHIL